MGAPPARSRELLRWRSCDPDRKEVIFCLISAGKLRLRGSSSGTSERWGRGGTAETEGAGGGPRLIEAGEFGEIWVYILAVEGGREGISESESVDDDVDGEE